MFAEQHTYISKTLSKKKKSDTKMYITFNSIPMQSKNRQHSSMGTATRRWPHGQRGEDGLERGTGDVRG